MKIFVFLYVFSSVHLSVCLSSLLAIAMFQVNIPSS